MSQSHDGFVICKCFPPRPYLSLNPFPGKNRIRWPQEEQSLILLVCWAFQVVSLALLENTGGDLLSLGRLELYYFLMTWTGEWVEVKGVKESALQLQGAQAGELTQIIWVRNERLSVTQEPAL